MVSDITTCKNCDEAVSGKFCCNCGQPVQVKRVDIHYLSHEIQHILHFEKGFLYTIKELLIRPGQNIKDFIAYNRTRLVKPIIFLIVASLIYSTIDHFFHVEEKYVNQDQLKSPVTNLILAWVQSHYGYANILMGVFIAWWIKLFFKSYPFNFFEILILLCFTMGMGMLITTVFTIVEGLFKISLITVSGAAGVLYCSWAIGQFFDKKKPANYIKSLFAYLLGSVSFYLAILIIGFTIDHFFKH